MRKLGWRDMGKVHDYDYDSPHDVLRGGGQG